MRVVPKSSSLLRGREIIEEGVSRGYGTLCHTNRAVGVGCPRLEESVPMLNTTMLVDEMNLCVSAILTIAVLFNMVLFDKLLITLSLN